MEVKKILLIAWMLIGLGLLVADLWFGVIWVCSGYLIKETENKDGS